MYVWAVRYDTLETTFTYLCLLTGSRLTADQTRPEPHPRVYVAMGELCDNNKVGRPIRLLFNVKQLSYPIIPIGLKERLGRLRVGCQDPARLPPKAIGLSCYSNYGTHTHPPALFTRGEYMLCHAHFLGGFYSVFTRYKLNAFPRGMFFFLATRITNKTQIDCTFLYIFSKIYIAP